MKAIYYFPFWLWTEIAEQKEWAHQQAQWAQPTPEALSENDSEATSASRLLL